jgi:hypothetical protein
MGTRALPPDLQSLLDTLFQLVAEYMASRSSRQRERLREQILQLFSQLGVETNYPELRRIAEIVDQIHKERPETMPWDPTPGVEARKFINAKLRNYERNQPIVLTGGAKQLLRIPVVETAELMDGFDPDQVDRSLTKILATLQEDPAALNEGQAQTRTSVAVIRAWWKNFCNIPPFCSGR